ncbi:MAG: YihA family ribosome biogenesis GTP-binding protein [Ruminococcaceae bacterium]|nr:YihA family ribosome biogenesis GTP-binding protein [Oscillospiraceae bacterium]
MLKFEKSEYTASYGTFKQLPPSTKAEIAFAGRSNVGKSSLLNKILNRKGLARVSSVPGKTVTINFYSVDNIYFADLPGYGYAKVSDNEKKRWADLMEGYFASDRNIKLVVVLTDMRRSITKDDVNMIEYLAHNNFRFAVVMTKSDKLNKTEYAKRLEEIKTELEGFNPVAVIPFSSLNGDGRDELRKVIDESVAERED